ncbi:MAG: CCA tRNA nucleotidyltransferase [Armatimonadetes bacterium]|nr:CCA tRNA nucleotidyltransferase [Armatimonadota bacterium]
MTIQEAWEASPTRTVTARIARERGVESYAVGGAVRDVLLGREPHDWDVASRDALRLARAVARELHAAFVWLHDMPATARVVIRGDQDGQTREELDYSDFRGDTIVEDLLARDFTVNSMAWRMDEPGGEIVDPCGGRDDLSRRIIRANGPAVLHEDPLRCLRAFRLASELTFQIDPVTLQWIARHARLIGTIPGERIGAEVVRLAKHPDFPGWLRRMDEAGLLEYVLPELPDLKGVTQGPYHHLDVWGHTLLVVEEIERIAVEPEAVFPQSVEPVRSYLADPDRLAHLKLAGLLHDAAKPQTRTMMGARVRFPGHERVGVSMARRVAERLRLTRAGRTAICRLTGEHMRPMLLVDSMEGEPPSLSATRRLLRDTDPDGVGLIVLAAADLLACRGPGTNMDEQYAKLALLDSMLARHHEWEQSTQFEPLLRGRDLIEDLHLDPGPVFSVLLDEVERAQTDGEITTREEALDLARKMLLEGPPETSP